MIYVQQTLISLDDQQATAGLNLVREYPTNADSIAYEIQLLIENCLGPRSIRARLAGWGDQLAIKSPDCFNKTEFRAALKDLIVLGCVSNVVEILWRRSPSGLICT